MKINPLPILLFFLIGCSNQSQTSDTSVDNTIPEELEEETFSYVTAQIKNSTDNKFYLYELDGEQPQKIDSSISLNDNISFTSKHTNQFNILGIGENQQNLLLIIAEKGDTISITSNYKEANFNYTISGSKNSVILKDYLKNRLEVINQINEVQQKINLLSFDAQQERNELISQAETIKNSFNKIKQDFILNNQNSPAIFIALYDLTNLMEEQNLLEIVAESISTHFPNTAFQQASIMLMNKANQQIEMQKQQLSMQQQQKQEMENAGIAVGKPAPELNFSDQNGKLLALSDLKGKVVLLDFWASWCGPCRRENPFVVGLYNKYKNKGFDIYSFSLDKEKAKWIQAIAQDGLIWKNHVSDLMGWQSLGAAKYLIRSIPQTFLIDRKGNIAEIGLRGNELEQKIIELL